MGARKKVAGESVRPEAPADIPAWAKWLNENRTALLKAAEAGELPARAVIDAYRVTDPKKPETMKALEDAVNACMDVELAKKNRAEEQSKMAGGAGGVPPGGSGGEVSESGCHNPPPGVGHQPQGVTEPQSHPPSSPAPVISHDRPSAYEQWKARQEAPQAPAPVGSIPLLPPSGSTAREVAQATNGKVQFDLLYLPKPATMLEGYKTIRKTMLWAEEKLKTTIPGPAQIVLRWIRDHFGEEADKAGARLTSRDASLASSGRTESTITPASSRSSPT